ncbi:MAG: cohesin domain-containing protein [Armatimonadota bacterium]
MKSATLLSIILALAAILSGCGGGGGGSSTPAPPTTLGLTVTEPALTGKTGQTVSAPVTVSGAGTVKTASFDLHFGSGIFEPVSGVTVGGSSVAVTGTSGTVAARYKWIDSQTVRVLYASSAGAASGSLLVNVPLKVKAETASALAVQNALVNK